MPVMTAEEHDALVQKVWDNSREKIEETVKESILTECRMGAASRTKHLVTREVDKLVTPLIEQRLQELQEAAEKAVSRIFKRIDAAIMAKVESLSYSYVEIPFKQAGDALTAGLKRAFAEAIREIRNEVQTDLQNPGRT